MKYFGNVGFVVPVEKSRGVFEEQETVRPYYGDIINRSFQWQQNSNLNDDINVRAEISIIADMYCYEHFPHIRFVEYMGTTWKVTGIRDERPRLILTIGGLWNGQ